MAANNITEEQLANSNEPSFTAALEEKRGAQKDAKERPQAYRKEEALILKDAKGTAQEQAAQTLTGMHGARGKNFDLVVKQQQTSKQKDEERRAAVVKEIEDKYLAAEAKVTKALGEADTEANRLFDEGSETARREFENYVDDKMKAYKRRRYSGFWGGLRWAKDKLFGMPDEVNAFYTTGRQLYLNKMDMVITQIANVVTTKLNEARQAITEGKKEIDDYVKQLPKDLEAVGKEAASSIQDKFDALEQSVQDKRDQLIDGLAKKYVDNVKKLDERITEMKEANQGLIDKAIGYLKKVWQVIKDLINLFTTILSRLASIIGVILGNPSGFFDNLGAAFNQGFNNFKDKFPAYLETGLMEWLATNMGIKGLEIPQKFDAAAIFSLSLQVMGITKQHIRERAVVLLGEEKVSLPETAGGILHRVYNEGLGAIWDMIAQKLSDLKETIWEAIKSYIQKRIIEEAIKFILSLLSPVGAFVKVCMAIYDFLMMLVRFKDRIIELFDTILNAVMSIASGAVDAAAKAIEGALAKSISVIIGFLAALLHLNNVAGKVREIIMRIQKRVEKAIDFVILKAYSLISKTVEGALRMKQKGKEMVKKGKTAIAGWLGFKQRFTTQGGISHTAYIRQGATNSLIIESTPVEAITFLSQKETEVQTSAMDTGERTRKLGRIRHGRNLLQGLNALMNNEAQRDNPRIPQMINEVIQIIREIDPSAAGSGPLPEKAVFDPGFSDGVKATSFYASHIHKGGTYVNQRGETITVAKNHRNGSEPGKTQLPVAFSILQGMRLSEGVRGVRFHIVNADFGGLGVDSNLIPTPGFINNPQYLNEFEVPLKGYYNTSIPIWIRASITYRVEYNGVFPLQYTARGGAMKYQGTTWVSDDQKQVSFMRVIPLPRTERYDINQVISIPEMEDMFIRDTSVTRPIVTILRNHQPAGKYTYYRQLERVIEKEVYGNVNREFTEVPTEQDVPRPTPEQLKKVSEMKHKLGSVNYIF